MSLAKKCDRCGKLYLHNFNRKNLKDFNGVTKVWVNNDNSFERGEKIDFCTECKADFEKWFKEVSKKEE